MRILLALTLLLTIPVVGQEMRTRVFQLNNRPAEATVEMVRPLLTPNGSVLPETRLNKLVVRDVDGVLEQVETLLKEIDKPAPQVRIFASFEGVVPWKESLAAVTTNGQQVSVVAHSGSGASSTQSEQNLFVMSGERAVLYVGHDLVTVAPYYDFALAHGLVPVQVVYQTVSTGFAVEPVVVGEVVKIKVTPWLRFQGPAGNQEVAFTESATSVAIRSGDTVTVASTEFARQEQSQSFGLIFGSGRRSSTTSASLRIRPVVE